MAERARKKLNADNGQLMRTDGTHSSKRRGLNFKRYFTRPGIHPYAEVEWEKRSAVISGEKGDTVFEQHDVEIPKPWSQLATNVVVSKYFRGQLGTPQREHSVKQLISRVVDTITGWGRKDGYFATEEAAAIFSEELTHLLVEQRLAFNSPVWFNVGVEPHPQCSACQPYHALVNTVFGPMPIGEIVEKGMVGLPVYDENGLTQVVAVKHNGRKPVYRVQLSDGFSVEATADHLVCAHDVRRTQTLQWRRVDQLRPGMVMRVYPHTPETITPPGSELEVSEAALAGWLQADGFVGQYTEGTNRALTLEFMTANEEEFQWVMQHVEKVFPDHHSHTRDVETKSDKLQVRRIRLYGEALRLFVERYDLLRRGTEIRVPERLWTASNDAVVAYLKSVFQADGYVSVQSPSARIGLATISSTWMTELQVLLTRVGIYSRLRKKEEKRDDRFDLWELDIAIHSERFQFAKQIGFLSSAKQAALQESLDLSGKDCPEVRFSTIEAITLLGEMDVYDIQTLSSHYLTNAVLVHNCFILSVDDKMDSILDWYRKEGVIFKGGSGSGVNLSRIRSSKERLAGGGTASGPVSFMRAADASAGVIKSGGKTRRAAKMVVLNADHPDVLEFVNCKAAEERKAWALIEAGYDSSIDGEAYSSVFFQNANNSVRVTDDFMRAVIENRPWSTRYVTTGDICETLPAKEMLQKISQATWFCGDPGMQFDTTINEWHTCPNTARINASNPCSEYMHLDDSACNLASLNLMKFLKDDGGFDTTAFKYAVDISITAQDILVDNSSYPTSEITVNAKAFRELGLGYANLGALLMSLGLPYDSEAGRQYAGAITALMTGEAYVQSARIAEQMDPFSGYPLNRDPMLGVIEKHRSHAYKLDPSLVPLDLLSDSRKSWDEALAIGRQHGYRNSQATVLAPTGTIAFMMDCDTTGVEPDIALIKYKRLVGGGMLKIVNTTVPRALKRLGYDSKASQAIVEYIDEHETIEGAPLLRNEHLPVFDCAFKPTRGSRSIHYLGHLRMMGAVQPFLSGAISKTINMPNDATVEDITEAYLEAWRLGLKAVAIYRDGCKRVQPLATGEKKADHAQPVAVAEPAPIRRRLPNDREAICHKFDIAGHEGYFHVGFYEDGSPGEIFIKMAKEGSTISGLMDTIATLTSLALQYGVPLEALVSKFGHVRFEPSGFTKNPEIPYAKSLTDYLFRFLGNRFLPTEQNQEVLVGDTHNQRESSRDEAVHAQHPIVSDGARATRYTAAATAHGTGAPYVNGTHLSHEDSLRSVSVDGLAALPVSRTWQSQADAPSCADCGSIMIRNGSCYKCLNCGATSGCS